MTVKLLTEHHLEFLSLKGGCTGSSESTLVKMPHLLEIICRGSFLVALSFSLFPYFVYVSSKGYETVVVSSETAFK